MKLRKGNNDTPPPNGTQPQLQYMAAVPARIQPAILEQAVTSLQTQSGAEPVLITRAEMQLINADHQQVDNDFWILTIHVPNRRLVELSIRSWAANTARLVGVPEIICIKQEAYLQQRRGY